MFRVNEGREGSGWLDSFYPFSKWRLADRTYTAVGRASVKRTMRPELIIKGHVVRHPLPSIVDGLVGMHIDVFIFEAWP